jgi:hypothetical protein
VVYVDENEFSRGLEELIVAIQKSATDIEGRKVFVGIDLNTIHLRVMDVFGVKFRLPPDHPTLMLVEDNSWHYPKPQFYWSNGGQ